MIRAQAVGKAQKTSKRKPSAYHRYGRLAFAKKSTFPLRAFAFRYQKTTGKPQKHTCKLPWPFAVPMGRSAPYFMHSTLMVLVLPELPLTNPPVSTILSPGCREKILFA